MLGSPRGISTPAIVGIVIVAIVAGGAAAYFALSSGTPSPSSSSSSSSSSSQSSSFVSGNYTALFLQHMQTIAARQVDAIVADYTSGAVVTWTGVTAGLGGTYSGSGNIRLLYAGALGTAQTIKIVPSKITVRGSTVNASLTINGTSGILGPFNGTISDSTTFTSSGGTLKVGAESWNFLTFFVTNGGGATTFPEWQRIGGPIPTHRSPDWFHNFSWDYGGPGMAILIWSLIVLLAALAVFKAFAKPSPKRTPG